MNESVIERLEDEEIFLRKELERAQKELRRVQDQIATLKFNKNESIRKYRASAFPKRNAEIVKMRLSGKSYDYIGAALKIKPSYVCSLFQRASKFIDIDTLNNFYSK